MTSEFGFRTTTTIFSRDHAGLSNLSVAVNDPLATTLSDALRVEKGRRDSHGSSARPPVTFDFPARAPTILSS